MKSKKLNKKLAKNLKIAKALQKFCGRHKISIHSRPGFAAVYGEDGNIVTVAYAGQPINENHPGAILDVEVKP